MDTFLARWSAWNASNDYAVTTLASPGLADPSLLGLQLRIRGGQMAYRRRNEISAGKRRSCREYSCGDAPAATAVGHEDVKDGDGVGVTGRVEEHEGEGEGG